jgi:hypothetical protein
MSQLRPYISPYWDRNIGALSFGHASSFLANVTISGMVFEYAYLAQENVFILQIKPNMGGAMLGKELTRGCNTRCS